MNILGINAYHGNASAAIVCDGRLVAAVEEERFNRVKYAAGFPAAAIRYCLAEAGITLDDVDHIAIPRNPWARLGTKLLYAVRMPRFARERVRVLARFTSLPEALEQAFDVDPQRIRARYHRVEHHLAHLEHFFRVAVRASCRALCRWAGRLCQYDVGHRGGQSLARARRRRVSPLARDVLHRNHAIPRLLEIRRRVQGYGLGRLRRAGLPGGVPPHFTKQDRKSVV